MIRYSVKDKLPEAIEENEWDGSFSSKPVLAWSRKGTPRVCVMYKLQDNVRWFEGCYEVTKHITHWAYIPEFKEEHA